MARQPRNLLIRADANTQIGMGHLMRCQVLACEWKARGGDVTFVAACNNETIKRNLSKSGFTVISLDLPYPNPQDLELLQSVYSSTPIDWVIVDGYNFDQSYHRRILRDGQRLLIVDDMAHLPHYSATTLLNQNLHASNLNYCVEKETRLLLGSRYVLLRDGFLVYRDWKRNFPSRANRILVTLGGSDPENATLRIVKGLAKAQTADRDLIIRVIAGPANPHIDALRRALSTLPLQITLLAGVEDMPEQLAWADIGFLAGGSTCWEACYMGLPIIATVLADNQEAILESLSDMGCAINMGRGEDLFESTIATSIAMLCDDADKRQSMSEAGRSLVDDLGAQRVIAALLED